VQVWDEFCEYTVYDVIGEPLSAGTPQRTVKSVPLGKATTFVGAEGGARGTTGLEATDAGPASFVFEAVTTNEYELPLVSPVTLQEFPTELPTT